MGSVGSKAALFGSAHNEENSIWAQFVMHLCSKLAFHGVEYFRNIDGIC